MILQQKPFQFLTNSKFIPISTKFQVNAGLSEIFAYRNLFYNLIILIYFCLPKLLEVFSMVLLVQLSLGTINQFLLLLGEFSIYVEIGKFLRSRMT